MFKERIEHEKKEKESDEKFRYKVINWYYDDVAINPDDTDQILKNTFVRVNNSQNYIKYQYQTNENTKH